ncbi:MAG: hypothetical protein JNM25_14805 [Planctomycetes bacterium]|nr:hypothetical protein [Planctomycetota bacterium]
MKNLCVTLLLALCASCGTVGTESNSTDGPAANVSAGGGGQGACCGDAATGGDCCSAGAKTQANAEPKVEAAMPGCCGACAPDAAPKQP